MLSASGGQGHTSRFPPLHACARSPACLLEAEEGSPVTCERSGRTVWEAHPWKLLPLYPDAGLGEGLGAPECHLSLLLQAASAYLSSADATIAVMIAAGQAKCVTSSPPTFHETSGCFLLSIRACSQPGGVAKYLPRLRLLRSFPRQLRKQITAALHSARPCRACRLLQSNSSFQGQKRAIKQHIANQGTLAFAP